MQILQLLRQSRDERASPPLDAAEVGERVMKNLGGQILGFPAATGAARDEGVDALEVPLVQLAEPAWILLGGLDQEALVALFRRDLCRRCPGPHLVHASTFMSTAAEVLALVRAVGHPPFRL